MNKIIYIISYSGVEWNDIREVYDDLRVAMKRKDYLNSTKNPDNIYDSLSSYEVSSLLLNKEYSNEH